MAALGTREFYRLLSHLSPEAVFRHLADKHPRAVAAPSDVNRALGRPSSSTSSSTARA